MACIQPRNSGITGYRDVTRDMRLEHEEYIVQGTEKRTLGRGTRVSSRGELSTIIHHSTPYNSCLPLLCLKRLGQLLGQILEGAQVTNWQGMGASAREVAELLSCQFWLVRVVSVRSCPVPPPSHLRFISFILFISHQLAISPISVPTIFALLHLSPRICITHLTPLSSESPWGPDPSRSQSGLPYRAVSSAPLPPLAHHLHPPFLTVSIHRPRLPRCLRLPGARRRPLQGHRDPLLNRNSRIAREAWPSDRPTLPPNPLHRVTMRTQRLPPTTIVRLPITPHWIV